MHNPGQTVGIETQFCRSAHPVLNGPGNIFIAKDQKSKAHRNMYDGAWVELYLFPKFENRDDLTNFGDIG